MLWDKCIGFFVAVQLLLFNKVFFRIPELGSLIEQQKGRKEERSLSSLSGGEPDGFLDLLVPLPNDRQRNSWRSVKLRCLKAQA
jgi:hypothetical protein